MFVKMDVSNLILRKHIFGAISTFYDVRTNYIKHGDKKLLISYDLKILTVERKELFVKDDLIEIHAMVFRMMKELSEFDPPSTELIKLYYNTKEKLLHTLVIVQPAANCQNMPLAGKVYLKLCFLIDETDMRITTIKSKTLKHVVHKLKSWLILHGRTYITTATGYNSNLRVLKKAPTAEYKQIQEESHIEYKKILFNDAHELKQIAKIAEESNMLRAFFIDSLKTTKIEIIIWLKQLCMSKFGKYPECMTGNITNMQLSTLTNIEITNMYNVLLATISDD